MAQLALSLLVISHAGEATEIRDATALSPAITIKVWPSVNEDETPGQDYGPARVVATMATPVVELVDGGFFPKFHQVWTTVVVRERKNRGGLFSTLYRTHDNRTYVEITGSGVQRSHFSDAPELITRADRNILEEARKFASTWERGVLHYQGKLVQSRTYHLWDRSYWYVDPKKMRRVPPDLWKPWECALLGEPGAPPSTMKWIHAQTKRGRKMDDLGAVYYDPAHYKYLKHFDETFDTDSEGKI